MRSTSTRPRGLVRNLDCFCAVPSGTGGELVELQVPFGEELVHYAVGAGLVRGPGRTRRASTRSGASTAGCRGATSVRPALRLAREGVPMPPAHVACLEMLAPVMTMREGARMYAPRWAACCAPASGSSSPAWWPPSSRSPPRARPSVYTGSIGRVAALARRRPRRGSHQARPGDVRGDLGRAGRELLRRSAVPRPGRTQPGGPGARAAAGPSRAARAGADAGAPRGARRVGGRRRHTRPTSPWPTPTAASAC